MLSTDEQTDNVQPVYPHFNFVEAGGKKKKHLIAYIKIKPILAL